jgi:hypothetical protein
MTTTQPLTIAMEPRVKTTSVDLQQQFALSKELYDEIVTLSGARERIRALRPRLHDNAALRKQAVELSGEAAEDDEEAPPSAAPDLETISSLLQSLRATLRLLQESDEAPTTQAAAAAEDRRRAFTEVMTRVRAFEEAAR